MSRPWKLGRFVEVADADYRHRWYWQDQQEDAAADLYTQVVAEPELPARWEHYVRAEQEDQLADDRQLRRAISRALAKATHKTARVVVTHQAGQHDPEEVA